MKVTTTFRLPQALHEALVARSQAEHMPLSTFSIRALWAALDHEASVTPASRATAPPPVGVVAGARKPVEPRDPPAPKAPVPAPSGRTRPPQPHETPPVEAELAQRPIVDREIGGSIPPTGTTRPPSTDKRQGYAKSEADCPNTNHHKFKPPNRCPTCGYQNLEADNEA